MTTINTTSDLVLLLKKYPGDNIKFSVGEDVYSVMAVCKETTEQSVDVNVKLVLSTETEPEPIN